MESTVPATGRRVVLERVYPLLKHVAELLELEAIEPQASIAKRLRADVGAEMAALGRVEENAETLKPIFREEA